MHRLLLTYAAHPETALFRAEVGSEQFLPRLDESESSGRKRTPRFSAVLIDYRSVAPQSWVDNVIEEAMSKNGITLT